MAKLRKFSAYQRLERPYTRVSKFSNQNYVRGGFPAIKISKFDMGTPNGNYDTTLKLNVERSMNIRHNALEAVRMTANRVLEKAYGKTIGAAARVKEGQTIVEIRVHKEHTKLGKEALNRAAKKVPCGCRIITG